MDDLSYRVLMGGKLNQIRRFIDAFDDELRPHFEAVGIKEAEDNVVEREELTFEQPITADAGTSSAVLGIVLFALAWPTQKILDEIFEDKFREKLRKLITKARENIPLNRKEKVEYRSVLCSPEGYPTVVVRMFVGESDTVSDLAGNIKIGHQNADSWIKNNGKQAEIHCYTIQNGQCNLEPILFNNIKELDEKNSNAVVHKWQ